MKPVYNLRDALHVNFYNYCALKSRNSFLMVLDEKNSVLRSTGALISGGGFEPE